MFVKVFIFLYFEHSLQLTPKRQKIPNATEQVFYTSSPPALMVGQLFSVITAWFNSHSSLDAITR
jgi:hypothetical protein